MTMKIQISIQRLRNLTTGKLHTKMDDIYEDIKLITGLPGVMTHQLPAACKAIQDWLKKFLKDKRFWDGKYDKTHLGVVTIKQMPKASQDRMLKVFGKKQAEILSGMGKG